MSLISSPTDIANMTLSNLGSGKVIADLDTERSQEAICLRAFYDTALRSTLRDQDYGFNRKIVSLTVVTDFRPTKTVPTDWDFSYQYPADALIVRRLGIGANRIDPMAKEIPWEQQAGQNGPLIFTDLPNATAQIGILVQAVELFPADFSLAFSMLLSALCAPRLTNGDPLKLGPTCFQKYTMMISTSQKNDIIQGNQRSQSQSDLISARD